MHTKGVVINKVNSQGLMDILKGKKHIKNNANESLTLFIKKN